MAAIRRMVVLALGLQLVAREVQAASEPYNPWPGLVQDIFGNRPMNDGSGVISIEMPYRAEDAAIVPVTLRTTLPPGDPRRVLSITFVIDRNPAPNGGTLRTWARRLRLRNFNPSPSQQLYRRSCCRRAE